MSNATITTTPGYYSSRARESAVGPRTSANWSCLVERSAQKKGAKWIGYVNCLGRFDREIFQGSYPSRRAAIAAIHAVEVTASDIEAAN